MPIYIGFLILQTYNLKLFFQNILVAYCFCANRLLNLLITKTERTMKDVYLRNKETGTLYHVWYISEDEAHWRRGIFATFEGGEIAVGASFNLLYKPNYDTLTREAFLKKAVAPKPKAGDWVASGDGVVGKVFDTDGITCRIMVAGDTSELYYCKLTKLRIISEEEILPLILKGMKDFEQLKQEEQ